MPAAVLAEFWDSVLEKFGTSIAVLVLSTVLSFTLGRWWGRYRARRQWEAKEFLGRVIVSLNSLVGGTLKIRTVFERNLEDVFLNPHAVELVQEASKRTTADNPLLPIRKEDAWFILNFVLNAIAEKFADGEVRRDAGAPVVAANYGLCLTCEVVGEERLRKVRAMLVRRDLLVEFPYPDSMPTLENPWHADRIVTLRAMSREYAAHPEWFLNVELCV